MTESGILPQVEKVLETPEDSRAAIRASERRRQLINRLPASKAGYSTASPCWPNRVEGLDRSQLRTAADTLRNKWRSAVVVIASVNDSGITIVSTVSKDLIDKVQAGKLVSEVAKATGGKGGGRPDMAEGAGKDPEPLPLALQSVYKNVAALL